MRPWLAVMLSPFEALQAIVAERHGDLFAERMLDYSPVSQRQLNYEERDIEIRGAFAQAERDLRSASHQGQVEARGMRVIGVFGELGEPESLDPWWDNDHEIDFVTGALKGRPRFERIKFNRRVLLNAVVTPAQSAENSKPELKPLTVADIRTGAPGKPTPAALIIKELERRIAAAEACDANRQEAIYLAKWFKDKHPELEAVSMKPESIENLPQLKSLMRGYKKSNSSGS